jgi:hypothetical protein
MSLVPFSPRELDYLKDFLENKGWSIEPNIENYFRYSLKKNNIIILTIKFPLTLPVRLNIPLEIVNFRISIVIKLWHLNENSLQNLLFIMKSLRDFAMHVSTEYTFPLEGKEKLLVKILNDLLPERIKNENERSWINRIRVSFLNKEDYFRQFDDHEISAIVRNLEEVGLYPTFKIPWELKEGIPKIRTSETLFFSNEEEMDEFFILEKGFLSYLKDLYYKKIHIRSSFESYTPYILRKLFNVKEVKLEDLIQNWIKFSRKVLNSILQIINSRTIEKNSFMDFRIQREMRDGTFIEEINNFPLTPLQYETTTSKDLYPIHNDLLNHPPVNFKVLETINYYTEAEELYNSYKFKEATKKLNEALKIFNKYKQKKMVVSILLFLRKIASLLNQDEVALNYLENALNVARSGEIPLEYIIKIQFLLGKIHYERKNFYKAREHFRIIDAFFEENQEESISEHYLGVSCIYLGIISAEENDSEKTMEYFKKAYSIAENSQKTLLSMYLIRAIHYKRTGEVNKTENILKKAMKNLEFESIDEEYDDLLSRLLLELAEFLIHNKKDSKNALYVLKLTKEKLNPKTVKGLKESIRWNLLMSDYYRYLERNSKESSFYIKQSKILKVQLQKLGIFN